jgi:transcriptional regulator with XRE-family HTH domain
MVARIKREPANGFGERLSSLRKAAGITQTAFAQEAGVSQRMMAYYEGPTAYPPANLLPIFAKVLGVSVDVLLGVEAGEQRVKATDTRMHRRFQQIEKLESAEKRQLLQLIDTFIELDQLKRKKQDDASGQMSGDVEEIEDLTETKAAKAAKKRKNS